MVDVVNRLILLPTFTFRDDNSNIRSPFVAIRRCKTSSCAFIHTSTKLPVKNLESFATSNKIHKYDSVSLRIDQAHVPLTFSLSCLPIQRIDVNTAIVSTWLKQTNTKQSKSKRLN